MFLKKPKLENMPKFSQGKETQRDFVLNGQIGPINVIIIRCRHRLYNCLVYRWSYRAGTHNRFMAE